MATEEEAHSRVAQRERLERTAQVPSTTKTAPEMQARSRILVLAKYWYPFRGGIEDNARSVANMLVEQYQVEVIAFDHGYRTGVEMMDGVTLNRVRTPVVLKSQPLSLDYFRGAVSAKADIIYVHAPNALASIALLFRRFVLCDRTPIIVMHHMEMFGRPFLRFFARAAYMRLLSVANKVIVTSRKNADNSDDIRIKSNLVVIPLGIDPSLYAVSSDLAARAAAWRHGLCGNAPVVVFVGRLARYKGVDIMVRALALLPAVHLLIGGDGPFREPNEALARELGVAERVHFLGHLSHEEKLRCLSAGDVFAFPSTEITEAFGISQLEAMAVGCPIVASNLPTGVTDVALNNETALLVPPGDEAALATALGRVLTDRVLAARLAENGRRHLDRNFTNARTGALNQALIAEVIAARTQLDGSD